MKGIVAVSFLCASVVASSPAQDTSRVALTVFVHRDSAPIEDARVWSGSTGSMTNPQGNAVLRLLPATHLVVVARLGFTPETLTVDLTSGRDTTVSVSLGDPVELGGIMVSATRSGRRIEDEPLRVEALSAEEVEEKLLMTPGDITMMLNESSGLRVQTTSPSLGGANVRVQGLRGRYTQILADGLPLYGGQTGGLGLLQIPPMDLGGVEIIKGVASALYGGSALGGVINLISRRPTDEPAGELLLNQTTLGGSDLVGFASAKLSPRWGYTALAGGHRQQAVDKDGDHWTDVPGYERVLVRPRVFWTSPAGHSVMITAGTTLESRRGGSMKGRAVEGVGVFEERLRTNRYDAGVVSGFLLGDNMLSLRGAAASQRHSHLFGDVVERDAHLTWLGESSLTIPSGRSLWVVGAAVQEERYRGEDVSAFDFAYTTPGVFAQNTLTLTEAVSVTASGRVDFHGEYGTQFAPRLSALLRLSPAWTLRASGGGGYFAPSPFTEETEVIGLSPLTPLRGLREERAQSASLDLGGMLASLEINATLFGSRVDHPVALRPNSDFPELVELINATEPTRTTGAELLLRWNPEPFHVTGSYTLVRSSEQDVATGTRRDTPLTPRHQAGVVTMWEAEDRARVGVEVYLTGLQSLEDNPYRTMSKPYVHVGLLAERRFGRARLFVNAENLLGYRQTKYDSLVLPERGRGGRWTTDVWGPLEGRVANAGLRLDLR